VTSTYGNACDHLGPDFINNCHYDFAGLFLSDAFAALGVSWNATPGVYTPAHLSNFSQVTFGASPANNSLADMGYIYVPAACAAGARCHLHINFHGCTQAASEIGDAYISRTQINEWAEANSIVVLYPQTTTNLHLANPLACWDVSFASGEKAQYLHSHCTFLPVFLLLNLKIWGYADKNYATNIGVQASVVWKVVEALFGY
jgi:hypothetical protein